MYPYYQLIIKNIYLFSDARKDYKEGDEDGDKHKTYCDKG